MDHPPTSRSLRALDVANLMLADVRDGLGPYLSIYLVATQVWSESAIGIAMATSGVAAVIAQTPAGALVDKVRHKRRLLAGASLVIGLGCVLMTLSTRYAPIFACQAIVGAASAIVAPTLAALSLGIVGRQKLSNRIGRNEAFNHAGNLLAAVLAGLIGWAFSSLGIFYLVGAFAILSMFSVLAIRDSDIDPNLANGDDDCKTDKRAKPNAPVDAADPTCEPSPLRQLLASRPLLIFAVVGTLFHLANGAMLPLAGQLLAKADKTKAVAYMSACIIAAQLVMVPVGVLAGRYAAKLGRRPLLILMASALPVRGLLYTFSSSPTFVVAVQLLDGIGAGLYGVLLPLVVADLTKGTGRFNSAQGAVATLHGIGGAVSPALGFFLAGHFGFNTAFFTLAGLSLAGVALTVLAMPETGEITDDRPAPTSDAMATP